MKLIFSIFGELFDPSSFTSSIAIEPTKSWQNGEKIPMREGVLRQESAWEYCLSLDTLFFEDLTKKFEAIFSNYIDQISEYCQQNNLSVKFDVVFEISDGQAPALYISRNFLNFACRLGAELDFDIYVL